MKHFISVLVLVFSAALHAELALGPLFQDNAVLQRDKPIVVWGSADPGETVIVAFKSDKTRAIADANGNWRAVLPAQSASTVSETLTVQGNGSPVTLQNILVGEVWICSGQSNMAWVVKNTNNAQEEIAGARYPLIRHIKIERNVAETPQKEVSNNGWQLCSPKTVGEFTAVGYYFAREIFRALDIPVGLINSSWGGTPIEPWISTSGYKANRAMERAILDRWEDTLADYPSRMRNYERDLAEWERARDKAKAQKQAFTKRQPSSGNIAGPGHRYTPSGLYNGMIAPLVPYSIRGAIWYQGEDNSSRHTEYARLFEMLITDWRKEFDQGDFPFYWVQLANYRANGVENSRWAYLREAQDKTLALPNTGQALAIDIGEETDIHPRNKQEIGRRLALIALARDYGFINTIFSGPRYDSMKVEGSTVSVKLSNADGLYASDNAPIGAFELAGRNKVFYPAKATINGDSIVLTSSEVRKPVAVRYAWRNFPNPGVNLYNSAKLPLASFRTDNWPEQ